MKVGTICSCHGMIYLDCPNVMAAIAKRATTARGKQPTPDWLHELEMMAQSWKGTELGAYYTIYDCTERLTKWIAEHHPASPSAEVPICQENPLYMPTMDEVFRFMKSNPITSAEMLTEIEGAGCDRGTNEVRSTVCDRNESKVNYKIPYSPAREAALVRETAEACIDALPGLGDTTWLAEQVELIAPIIAKALVSYAQSREQSGFAQGIERAAQIVLMDSCDRPECDIPAHQKAQARVNQIRSLLPDPNWLETERKRAYLNGHDSACVECGRADGKKYLRCEYGAKLEAAQQQGELK